MKEQVWPNFFIVGAMRAGTTSLHQYLSRVKGIYMSPIKEPNFFIDEDIGPLYRSFIVHINDEERYLALFRPKNGEIILGESSASYLWDSTTPNRIHAKNTEARIVILLRDPIERAYSHFLHHLHYGFSSNFDFFETIRNDYLKERKGIGFAHMYVELGMYSNQVQRYFDLFGRDRVKVIIYEDEFKPKTKEIVQDVVNFLGLKSIVPDEVVQKIYNSSSELISGSFTVPRFKGASTMSTLVTNIRYRNLFLTKLTSHMTSAIWKNFLIKNNNKPPLTEKASNFLKNIYRDDVEQLCHILRRTPTWAAKYDS